MKKNKLLLSVALGAVLLASCAKEEKQQIELPDLAKLFVSQNYSKQTVESVSNDSAAVYEVTLSDKTEITFNADGMWEKVKPVKGGSVNTELLPPAAAMYLQEIYSGKKVTLLERNIPTGLMRVTLDDGLEIVFTSEGQIV